METKPQRMENIESEEDDLDSKFSGPGPLASGLPNPLLMPAMIKKGPPPDSSKVIAQKV